MKNDPHVWVSSFVVFSSDKFHLFWYKIELVFTTPTLYCNLVYISSGRPVPVYFLYVVTHPYLQGKLPIRKGDFASLFANNQYPIIVLSLVPKEIKEFIPPRSLKHSSVLYRVLR